MTSSATVPQLGPGTHSFDYVYPVEPDRDGRWRVRADAGGAGSGPRRSTPWVDLGGGGCPDQFFAGGRIDDGGIDIARVELRFANGITLQDDTDEGSALFITHETVAMPGTVVLLDQAGNEIAMHRPFPSP